MSRQAVTREPSSFRDPTGFVYSRDGEIYRQIHAEHAADWQGFHDSGLYARLVECGWLIEHEEVPSELGFDSAAWRVVRPRRVGFVSYPYEWAFSQLKDAALLTLDAQAAALEAGMTLKDASAYNVQFEGPRPVLIDPLSFEQHEDGSPWVAYRQFCQHFLAPLALMAQRDVRLGLLLRDYIDGLPLDLAVRLLPLSSRLRMGQAAHLHLHARAQRSHSTGDGSGPARVSMSRSRLEALLDSLRSTITGLRWKPAGTEWADYGLTASYSERAAASKRAIVERFLKATEGTWVWDLGANTGFFSRLAADLGRSVLALDGDPAAAEQHYLSLRQAGSASILPLVMDLANPSPALGWAHSERRSLAERANADTILALAVVHHLAIGNNVPLDRISDFLARLGRQVIIEFVPKSDTRVAHMLANRRDVFADYSLDGFRAAFEPAWELLEQEQIEDSERVLLRFRRRPLAKNSAVAGEEGFEPSIP